MALIPAIGCVRRAGGRPALTAAILTLSSSVAEAFAALLTGLEPLSRSLASASRRRACRGSCRRLTQPPFDASAMDGSAVRRGVGDAPATLRLIGTRSRGTAPRRGCNRARPCASSPALRCRGRRHRRDPGEHRCCSGVVTVKEARRAGHIRPRGQDFSKGEALFAPAQGSAPRADARRRHEPCRASGPPQAEGRDPRHRR